MTGVTVVTVVTDVRVVLGVHIHDALPTAANQPHDDVGADSRSGSLCSVTQVFNGTLSHRRAQPERHDVQLPGPRICLAGACPNPHPRSLPSSTTLHAPKQSRARSRHGTQLTTRSCRW